MIADLCEEGYRSVAPKSLVGQLDRAGPRHTGPAGEVDPDVGDDGGGALSTDLDASGTLERLVAICATLPECSVEGTTQHRLRVGTKTVGWHAVSHHGDGRIALTVRATKGDNAVLVAGDPSKFFLPPYVAHHGYVGIYLDTEEVDWQEVSELVTDAYLLVAPKRLVRLVR